MGRRPLDLLGTGAESALTLRWREVAGLSVLPPLISAIPLALVPSLGSLGVPMCSFGRLSGRLQALLSTLGARVGASWAVLGRSRRPLEPPLPVGCWKLRDSDDGENFLVS